MRTITIVLSGVLLLAGCGGNAAKTGSDATPTPNVAACEAAMRAQFQRAMNDPDAPSGSRPPECAGVDDATLEKLAGKIIGGG